MNTRWFFSVAIAGLLAMNLPGALANDPPADKGKRRILPLFSEIITPYTESVVKVYVDDKQVALGTIVSDDGFILTKGSELRGDKIVVKLKNGERITAVKHGYERKTDLALLKIEKTELIPLKFTTEDYADIGNWVAIPGQDANALGAGVVSVKTRALTGFEESRIENANKGVLGVRLDMTVKRVKIDDITETSPAGKAGLLKGDIIVEVASNKITNPESLFITLDNFKPGETVTVRVIREEKELDFKVKLGSRIDLSGPGEQNQSLMQNAMGGLLSDRRTGFPKVIQHDTIIDPKNCGGPLVDLDGRVLGLNIARAGRVETWTLPAPLVRSVLKELRDGKHFETTTPAKPK
jgi:serine protease Do